MISKTGTKKYTNSERTKWEKQEAKIKKGSVIDTREPKITSPDVKITK